MVRNGLKSVDLAPMHFDSNIPTKFKLENSLGSRPAFTETVLKILEQFKRISHVVSPPFPPSDSLLQVRDNTLASGIKFRVYILP